LPRRQIDSLRDPKNGVTTGTKKAPSLAPKTVCLSQASIFFRWANWMVRNVPAGKKPLFINMDETSVGLSYPGQKGNVVQQPRTTRPRPETYTEKVTLTVRRGNITYCAFVASESFLQPLLPQILICNRQRFTRQVLRHAWREQPGFVQTWAAESGWVNHTLMKQMITVLHNCIREHIAEHQIILVVDAARCPIHRDIVNHACKHDMWMLYVPAKMTWLLQPLDAYVFAGFKADLKQQFADPQYATDTTTMLSSAWLRRLWQSIHSKIQSLDWKNAFAKVGLLDQQRSMSEHVAAFTSTTPDGSFGCGMPSPNDLHYVLGGKLDVPHTQLTRPVLLRSTGPLSHLWPGALPRPSNHGITSSTSAAAVSSRGDNIATICTPSACQPSPWPRAMRMGQIKGPRNICNRHEPQKDKETASQMNPDSQTDPTTDIEIPRATRMMPSRSRRSHKSPEAKKEVVQGMTP